MFAAVRQLFAISGLQVLAGLATGVLLARSLGSAGRGDLAAVMAPLGLAPYVLAVGMTTYATRAAARGVPIGRLLGTLGTASLLIGAAAIPLGLWLATILANGRRPVEVMISVGVVLLPLTLLGGIVSSIAMGLEEWSIIAYQRLIPAVVPLPAFAVLYAMGGLTVLSSALVLIIAGVLAMAPMVGTVRRSWPPVKDRRVLSDAVRYGAKVTPITLSQILNHRLDQVLMAPLVTSHQLGIYAVAVTVAGLSGMLSSAISTVIFPRAAQEAANVNTAQVIRLGLATVLALAILLGAISPLAVPLLFGSDFSDAYPVIVVLLVASLPLTGVSLFAAIYTARNKIGIAGLSEIVALVMTIAGLLVLLRPLGAMGAAIVSLIAYSVNFLWLALMAPRYFGGRFRDYVVPRLSDLRDLFHRARQFQHSAAGGPKPKKRSA